MYYPPPNPWKAIVEYQPPERIPMSMVYRQYNEMDKYVLEDRLAHIESAVHVMALTVEALCAVYKRMHEATNANSQE